VRRGPPPLSFHQPIQFVQIGGGRDSGLGKEAGGSQLAVGLDWLGGKVADGEKRLNERYSVIFSRVGKSVFIRGAVIFYSQ